MILRKPYAFLIKYFRLLHVFVFGMLCYILYKTVQIASFLSSVVRKNNGYLGLDLVDKYVPTLLKIFPILVIIFLIIIIWVFIFKKKECKEYMIMLGMVFASYVILLVSISMLSSLEVTIQEIRTIRLVSDLSLISCFLYAYPLIISFIRTTGFDIKKFDFEKDLLELDINEKDREEFEVDFKFDSNLAKRKLNRNRRHLIYFYKEYKFFIYLTLILIISLTGYVIYNNEYKLNQNIKYNEVFSSNLGNFNVVESYVVSTNYRGDTLDDLYDYEVIKIQAKTNSHQLVRINTAYFELHINDHIFYHKTENVKALGDLGKVYGNAALKADYQEYLLVYKIPKRYDKKGMQFKVIKTIGKFLNKDITNYYILNLDNIKYIKNNGTKKFNLNEEVKLSGPSVNNNLLTINSIELANTFKIDYNYKIGDKVIPSVEYVARGYYGSYYKTVLKLKYTYDGDLGKLLKNYGSLKYTINGIDKTADGINVLEPFTKQDGIIYLEVPYMLTKSSDISLILNIRTNKYECILRGEK